MTCLFSIRTFIDLNPLKGGTDFDLSAFLFPYPAVIISQMVSCLIRDHRAQPARRFAPPTSRTCWPHVAVL